MNKKRNFEIGELYHLYARGTDKRETYIEEIDYARMMALLYVCNTKQRICLTRVKIEDLNYLNKSNEDQIVRLEQFCLMPNHFHILALRLLVVV